jgi:chemotaxis-related protein WspD
MSTTDHCWTTKGILGDRSCPDLQANIHCRNCVVYAAAGRALLDRQAPDSYLAGWTDLLAQKKPAQEAARVSIVIFRVGLEWLALPVRAVKEITPTQKVHHLPHRSDAVLLGIVNIRGEIQLCISLAGVLGLEAVDSEPVRGVFARMMVLEKNRDRWAFPVDEVEGVCRFDARDVGNLPVTLGKAAVRFTTGVIAAGGRSIGILDDELLTYSLKRATG